LKEKVLPVNSKWQFPVRQTRIHRLPDFGQGFAIPGFAKGGFFERVQICGTGAVKQFPAIEQLFLRPVKTPAGVSGTIFTIVKACSPIPDRG